METKQLQATFSNSIKPIEYMLRDQIGKTDGIWEYVHKFQCQHADFSNYIDLALFKSNSRIRPLINFFWMDSDLLFLQSLNSTEQPEYSDSKFWTIIIEGDGIKTIVDYSDIIFSKIESTEYFINGTAQSQDTSLEQLLEKFITCVDIFAKEILPINDIFTKTPYIYIPIIVINKNIKKCTIPSSTDFANINLLETSFNTIGLCQYQMKYQSTLVNFQKPSKFGDLKNYGRRTVIFSQADKLIELLYKIPEYL